MVAFPHPADMALLFGNSVTKRAAWVASGGLGLVGNHVVRQCLLELLYAFVGGLGVCEVQLLQVGQSFQVLQAGVGDLSPMSEYLRSFHIAREPIPTRSPAPAGRPTGW